MVHADIDPAEIGKNRNADVPIVGDVRPCIVELIEALRRAGAPAATADWTDGGTYLRGCESTLPAELRAAERRQPEPRVRDRAAGRDRRPGRDLRRRRGPAPDVGRQFISYEKPGPGSTRAAWARWATRFPAAMGAKFARPGRRGVGDRRRRLLPDDQPGAGHLRHRGHRRSRSRSSTTATWAWCGSGRRCSTTSGTPRPTWARTAPDPRLRQAGRGAGLRRVALRACGRRGRINQAARASTTGRW